jgi:chromatin remodeling complex protein RSC6
MEAGKSKKQKDAVVERRAAADKAKMEAAAAGSATADFMKLVQPDDKLAVIVGAKPLPRTELTKKLWTYIKKHGLQDEKVRTQINADDALKAVFNGKKSVSMFEMTALLSGHVKSTETNNPKKPFSTPTYGDRKSSEPKPRPKPRPKPKKPEAVWETIGRWIFGSKW